MYMAEARNMARTREQARPPKIGQSPFCFAGQSPFFVQRWAKTLSFLLFWHGQSPCCFLGECEPCSEHPALNIQLNNKKQSWKRLTQETEMEEVDSVCADCPGFLVPTWGTCMCRV